MDGERERGERGVDYRKKAWGSGGGKGERGREKEEVESVERNRAELLSDTINVSERERDSSFLIDFICGKQLHIVVEGVVELQTKAPIINVFCSLFISFEWMCNVTLPELQL